MRRYKVLVQLSNIKWDIGEEVDESLPEFGLLEYKGYRWGKEDIIKVLEDKYHYTCLDIRFEVIAIK